MTVREEIENYASETDKPILYWLLDRYHWESQWRFVAKCSYRSYGSQSYEVHRIWKPTTEGVVLYINLAKSSFDEYIDQSLASGISGQCPYEFLVGLKKHIEGT